MVAAYLPIETYYTLWQWHVVLLFINWRATRARGAHINEKALARRRPAFRGDRRHRTRRNDKAAVA